MRLTTNLILFAFLFAAIGRLHSQPAAPKSPEGGMVYVSPAETFVGTSAQERLELSTRFKCDASWLNDDLDKKSVRLAPFWIDRSPVTNAEYARFVQATGARAPWPSGHYSEGMANHPVVNVMEYDAEAYAKWAGKRLPTAEEWEIACRSARFGLFPWGDDWPHDANVQPARLVDWNAVGTDAIGTGRHGRSACGMEDFVQQVCEWTSNSMPHHGTTFLKVKGTSWLHRDPVNFRTAATSSAMAGYPSPLIGFRCALDGDKHPPALPVSSDAALSGPNPPAARPVSWENGSAVVVYRLHEVPADLAPNLLDWNLRFFGDRPQPRGFFIYSPALGPWPVSLFFCEALSWSGTPLRVGPNGAEPALTKVAAPAGRCKYQLDYVPVSITCEFQPGPDFMDLVTEITNKTDQPGEFASSTCSNLSNQPAFYDADMDRTYFWTRTGGFVLMRNLPRPGECVRWIQAPDLSHFGGAGSPGMMAVVSRDGAWTFASVRFGKDAVPLLTGNTWLNCLHTDANVTIAAHSSRTTRQRLYFLRGGLSELKARVDKDLHALGED